MKKTTRRALFLSFASMFLCFTMLLGTTYAWFTDSVESGVNKIVAGNLDVELYNAIGVDNGAKVDNTTKLFDKIELWEPGAVVYENLTVANEGTLALKYQLGVEIAKANETKDLSEVLKVAVVKDGITTDDRAALLASITDWQPMKSFIEEGKLEASTTSTPTTKTYGIVIYWEPSPNDNDYNMNNNKGAALELEIGVKLYATQLEAESDSFGSDYDEAAGTAFTSGKGTEDDPYIINEASQLLGISDCDEYTYFKVADGVATLDMTGIGKIKLNGSFDGNGVIMNNLTTALFQSVGDIGAAQDIVISNFTANVHTTDGSALVKNIYNPGTTTFENVTLHGYLEGQYNVGSFYNYGTANHGSSDGSDYTVNFVNAKSDVTLVCTTGNAIGGMLGHGFEGASFKLSINMDSNSGYTGKMYSTGTATCYQVMAMCSHGTYVLNGVEVSRYDNTYPSEKLTKVAPTAEADGYYVAPVAGADHYVVYLNSQLTAYDDAGVKIDNKAGMTWNLGKETVTALDGKIFDLITSAQIVNDANGELGYTMNNGELTINSGRADNYASGWVTLQVNQYDTDGTLLATGIVTVYTFVEP